MLASIIVFNQYLARLKQIASSQRFGSLEGMIYICLKLEFDRYQYSDTHLQGSLLFLPIPILGDCSILLTIPNTGYEYTIIDTYYLEYRLISPIPIPGTQYQFEKQGLLHIGIGTNTGYLGIGIGEISRYYRQHL